MESPGFEVRGKIDTKQVHGFRLHSERRAAWLLPVRIGRCSPSRRQVHVGGVSGMGGDVNCQFSLRAPSG